MLLDGGEYKESLDHVVKIISSARSNAVQKASAEMIRMYWLVGNELVARSEWGNKYIETLSRDIRAAFPGIKGFSVRSLKYMAKFAREVDSELCNSYCTIPWGHVVKLLDKTKLEFASSRYCSICLAPTNLSLRFSSRHSIGALDRSARLVRLAPRHNQRHHSPRCSYRKTEWLRTACLTCVTQADYRLAYILDKSAIGEKVCRPLHELRQADGGARERRQLRLHLREVGKIDSTEPLRQGALNMDGVLAAPPY